MPLLPHHSPWGGIDHSVSYGEGVYFVSTPSHGGLALAPEIAAILPKSYLAKAIRQGS